jgi:hypothetical protein
MGGEIRDRNKFGKEFLKSAVTRSKIKIKKG